MDSNKRFWDKVNKIKGGCWEWTAALDDAGRPMFHGDDGKLIRAYRYSYELAYGPIPEGMVIDHVCKNVKCVNPSPKHIRLATNRQNAIENSVSVAAINHAKTQCIHGHPLTGDNLILIQRTTTKWPERVCRICHNLSKMIWYSNKKDASRIQNIGVRV